MSVRTRKKRAHRKKRQPLSKAMLALVIVLVIFGAGGVAVAAAAAVWLQDLPDYKDSSAFNYAQKTSVYANDGTTVLASASAEAGKPVRLKLPEAALWSPEHPQLYTLQAAYGTDTAAARFGIRSLAWGREGLLLNGSRIILQLSLIHI